MATFVYVTKECIKEAELHGCDAYLASLVAKVRKSQDTRHFDHFPAPYLVKKKAGMRQARLIAERRSIPINGESHMVIVILGLLIRGDHDYLKFNDNPREYGKSALSARCSDLELAQYLEESLQREPPPEKRPPSPSEHEYLYAFSGTHDMHISAVVRESKDWVSQVQSEGIQPQLLRIYDALERCVMASSDGSGELIEIEKSGGHRMLLRYLPDLQPATWFLIGIVGPGDLGEEGRLRDAYREFLRDSLPGRDLVLQKSLREYPDLVLLDQELWQRMEREPLGNLALSPEEMEVLSSAQHPEGNFPLFINGRAGSGKSTILQYLFAGYLAHHVAKNPTEPPPVYFTYNPELLRQARQLVESLLHCNARHAETLRAASATEKRATLPEGSFQEFHAYLRSLLGDGPGAKRFDPARRITYARFRRLWEQKYGHEPRSRREHGPDVSWHVIRTYIKGSNPDSFLEPDDYEQLEQKQVTVPLRTYKQVYDRVWQAWYRPLTGDDSSVEWDDQDLVRFIIENDLADPRFPAIFCDEAQDFTKVELDLILRLSLFSQRRVPPHDICRIPFVFAGDPFQTLNPTGFRWETLKAWYVERLIFVLDPNGKSEKQDLNYRELTYNYRSAAPVVKFSNFVQALRAALFDLRGLKPQAPWSSSPANPVVFFETSNQKFWETISAQRDVVFIVPVLDGEELDYVRKDPMLSRWAKGEQDDTTRLTILSPSKAKGLEFSRVVVYGFGDACDSGLLEPLRSPGSHNGSPEHTLPLEYFLNQLYVAVSRARQQLFVVDTAKGSKHLWDFARDPILKSAILDRIKDGKKRWESELSGVESGRPEHLGSGNSQDLLENAKKLEEEGVATRDSYLLRQASAAYRNAGRERESTVCRARADQFDGKFCTAGDLWVQVGLIESAIHCFWRGGAEGRLRILEMPESFPEVRRSVEYAFADFLSGSKEFSHGISAVRRLADAPPSTAPDDLDSREAWNAVVSQLLTRALSAKGTGGTGFDWKEFYTTIQRLAESGMELNIRDLAEVAYRADEFKAAKLLWEKAGETAHERYKRARVEVADYPGILNELRGLEEKHYPEKWKRIVQEAEARPDLELTGLAAGALGIAYIRLKQYQKALPPLARCNSRSDLMQAAEVATKVREFAIAEKLWMLAAVDGVVAEDWTELARLIGLIKGREAMVNVARALARSEGLPLLSGSPTQKQISERLRSFFVADGVGKLTEGLVEEIGSAIERAGNRVDSLQFYESVLRHEAFAQRTRDLAGKRWIACKDRQADFEKARGEERQYEARRREADEMRSKLGISSGADLPKYPKIGHYADIIDFREELIKGFVKAGSELAGEASKETLTPWQRPEDSGPVGGRSTRRGSEPLRLERAAEGRTEVRIDDEAAPPRIDVVGTATEADPVSEDTTAQDRQHDAPAPAHRPPSIGHSVVRCGKYRLEYFPMSVRINISDEISGLTLSIKEGGAKIEGDWEIEAPGAEGWRVVRAAEFAIRIERPEDGVRFLIRFPHVGTTVQFESRPI